MRRRAFITLLGGAVAWPLAARGQQMGKLPTIGFLGSSTLSAMSEWIAAFVQRLRERGWIEGRTVAVEYRWAEGRAERAAEIAAEFVRLKVDVIVTYATPPTLAAKQATSAIPIVFAAAGDPLGAGLVASLARPGGNVTGLSLQSTDLVGKRLELLREVVPGLHRFGDRGQCRQPIRGAGDGRGSDSGPHARARGGHTRNPGSAGCRPRPRGAQWPRGGTLCRYRPSRTTESI
jgi:putative ABC transport system substrate-binding protein